MSLLFDFMKRIVFASAFLAFLLLPACQRAEDSAEPITLFPQNSAVESTTAAPAPEFTEPTSVPAVNKTYGQTLSQIQSVQVLDTAQAYRTEDSYRLEQKAVEAAKAMFCAELYDPSSFNVLNSNVWNCVDDGENVYYSIYIKASYTVESGETMQSGFFGDVGVRKADETAFDAADTIDAVTERYDPFREEKRNHAPFADTDFEQAARTIALQRLKYPDSASQTVVRFIGESDASPAENAGYRQYDVFCEAKNDYGMQIPCFYSVYLRSADGKISEVDPAES